MDSFVYDILTIMVLLGIMVMTSAVIMFMIGIIKKHSIWTKIAVGSISMYAFFVVTIICLDFVNKKNYDEIQFISTSEKQVTILNRGNSEMNNYVRYALTKDNILEFKNYTKHSCHLDDKHGVTFEILNPGEVYVVIFENDYGDWAYADVYKISVDISGNATIKNVNHISPIEDIALTQSKLIDEYNFLYEDLNAIFIEGSSIK